MVALLDLSPGPLVTQPCTIPSFFGPHILDVGAPFQVCSPESGVGSFLLPPAVELELSSAFRPRQTSVISSRPTHFPWLPNLWSPLLPHSTPLHFLHSTWDDCLFLYWLRFVFLIRSWHLGSRTWFVLSSQGPEPSKSFYALNQYLLEA